MSHGAHVPIAHPEREKDISESFGDWALGQIPFLITQAISLILALSTFIYYFQHSEEKLAEWANFKKIERILFILNLIFCVFCVIKLKAIYQDNSSGEFVARNLYDHTFNTKISNVAHNKRRKQSQFLLRRFKLYFLFFWVTMVVLYAVFTVNSLNPQKEKILQGSVVTESKPDINTYLASNENRDSMKLEPSKLKSAIDHDEIKNWGEAVIHKWDAMITYWLNTLSIMFILWCFSVMAVRAQHPTTLRKIPVIIRLSPFLTFLLLSLYPGCLGFAAHQGTYYEESLNNFTVFFDAISGVLNAVVVALFIARLDSKFVSLPSNLIGLLYLYSAIQPLFLVFDSPGFVNATIKVCVLLLVFVLKIYFFFIITYAIQEGKIFAYLYCFSTLSERVEAFTNNSYVIRPEMHLDHIVCSIFLKKSKKLKVIGQWHDLKHCKEFITQLQTVAANTDNFYLEERSGSFYLVIKDATNIDYAVSAKPVGSKQQFAEMKEEFLHKIPYCKVDLSEVNE
jgi:hypothetical protein